MDGKVLLGGAFTTLQPNGAASTPRNRIARVNSDGTLDAGFDPNASNSVLCLAMQPDGKILLGGQFTTLRPNGAASSTQRRLVARVNPDGTLDSGFFPDPLGSTPNVSDIAVQWDGKILLGGNFTTLQPNGGSSVTRNRVARVNGNGTLDAGFNPNANNTVECLALQMDGKILLGGRFTALQPNGPATTRNGFARLTNDSATQTLAAPNPGEAIWSLDGAGPEMQSVTFDLSNDGGGTWISLGSGVRVAGGWRIGNLSLSGDGRVRARGQFTNGKSSGLFEQTVNFSFVAPFDAFVTGFGLNPLTTGAPDIDHDKDGVVNLLEFVFGGNPVVPNPNLLPGLTTTPVAGGRNLVFTYKRKLAASSISQTIEHAADLSSAWAPAIHGQNGVTIATTPVDAETEQVTVTIPVTGTKRFVRLKASR